MKKKNWCWILRLLQAKSGNCLLTIMKGPLIMLKEGETIKIGDDELEIRFTPGHSPGSVCFYHEAGGFVIGGDVFLMEVLAELICRAEIMIR